MNATFSKSSLTSFCYIINVWIKQPRKNKAVNQTFPVRGPSEESADTVCAALLSTSELFTAAKVKTTAEEGLECPATQQLSVIADMF